MKFVLEKGRDEEEEAAATVADRYEVDMVFDSS